MDGVKRTLRDLHEVDVGVYSAVAKASTPTLDTFMRRLSDAANYSRLSIASAALISVTYGKRGRRAAGLGLASIGMTSLITNTVVKPVARRRRPERHTIGVPEVRHVKMPTTRSFPSGHSAAAYAFASSVGHTLPSASGPLHVLAATVAYSRIHTGVHYPGDTLAGALLGTVIAHATTRALERQFGNGQPTRTG